MQPTDEIIQRYTKFWDENRGMDFGAMAKVLRGLIGYVKGKHGDITEHIELITEYADELERFLPLMDLDEFVAASRVLTYATRAIENSGTINYGAGLGRDISAEEVAKLRSTGDARDRELDEDRDKNSDSLVHDLHAESADD